MVDFHADLSMPQERASIIRVTTIFQKLPNHIFLFVNQSSETLEFLLQITGHLVKDVDSQCAKIRIVF